MGTFGGATAAEDGVRGRWIPSPPSHPTIAAAALPAGGDSRLPSRTRPGLQTRGHCDRVAVARQRGRGNRSRHPPTSGCEALPRREDRGRGRPGDHQRGEEHSHGARRVASQADRLRGAGSAARSAALTSSARRMSNGSFIVPPDFPATAQARARRVFSPPAQNTQIGGDRAITLLEHDAADHRLLLDSAPTTQARPATGRSLGRRSPPAARRQAQPVRCQGVRDFRTPPGPGARNRSSSCARSPEATQPSAPSTGRIAGDAPALAQTSRQQDRTPRPARQSSCRRTP